MLFLDSSAIIKFLDCRESYRLSYVENLAPKKPNYHRVFGIATHKAVEAFWLQKPFEEAFVIAGEELNQFPWQLLGPKEQMKWSELVQSLPDMVACYYDSVEWEEPEIVEMEWQWPRIVNSSSVMGILAQEMSVSFMRLCGRIDLMVNGCLRDLKTASEIGDKDRTWKQSFREQQLRNFGLQLYDWYLCQIGKTPTMIQVDALLKPYRDRKPRMEFIPLPEMVTPAYRKRFEQQLKMICSEIARYHEEHARTQPWPMNSNLACNHKYGCCEFLETVCLYGKKEDKLGKREEHLTTISR